jgi:hypothetical protein
MGKLLEYGHNSSQMSISALVGECGSQHVQQIHQKLFGSVFANGSGRGRYLIFIGHDGREWP